MTLPVAFILWLGIYAHSATSDAVRSSGDLGQEEHHEVCAQSAFQFIPKVLHKKNLPQQPWQTMLLWIVLCARGPCYAETYSIWAPIALVKVNWMWIWSHPRPPTLWPRFEEQLYTDLIVRCLQTFGHKVQIRKQTTLQGAISSVDESGWMCCF